MVYKYLKLFICAIASVSTAPLSFISYGDWGAKNDNQKLVADTIAKYTDTYNSSFNLVLGNNFYETGVTSTNDKLWETNYKNVYKNNNPWYVVLGNHDYYGNVSAQIAYTGMDDRWNMPSNNYVIVRDNLKIIMLDTQILDPECSDVTADTISKTNKYSPNSKAKIYKWLTNELRTYGQIKIVVGHAGIYSAGEHGNCNELTTKLFPLLDSYNVDLYLHGHSHMLEYNSRNSLNMFGCGSASKLAKYDELKFASEYTRYYRLDYGFCFHMVNIKNGKYNIVTKFINQDGDVLFQHDSNDMPYVNPADTSMYYILFRYLIIIFGLITCLYCCHAVYLTQIYMEPNNIEHPGEYAPKYAPRYNPNILPTRNPHQHRLIDTGYGEGVL